MSRQTAPRKSVATKSYPPSLVATFPYHRHRVFTNLTSTGPRIDAHKHLTIPVLPLVAGMRAPTLAAPTRQALTTTRFSVPSIPPQPRASHPPPPPPPGTAVPGAFRQTAIINRLHAESTNFPCPAVYDPPTVSQAQAQDLMRYAMDDGEGNTVIKSGPFFSRVKHMIRNNNMLDGIDMELIMFGDTVTKEAAARFRALQYPAGVEDQYLLCYHGVRSVPGQRPDYSSHEARFNPVSASKVSKNANRAPDQQLRLGDGVYFSTHLSYNMRNIFFECHDDGDFSILLCLLRPGKEFHVGVGSATCLTSNPDGHHSRSCFATSRHQAKIYCTDVDDSFFVLGEMRIRGFTY